MGDWPENDALPIAPPDTSVEGGAIDTERDGVTEMRVLVLTTNGTVFAAKIEGDDFPRLLQTVDGSWLLGNGQVDPADIAIGVQPNGGFGVQLIATSEDGSQENTLNLFPDRTVADGPYLIQQTDTGDGRQRIVKVINSNGKMIFGFESDATPGSSLDVLPGGASNPGFGSDDSTGVGGHIWTDESNDFYEVAYFATDPDGLRRVEFATFRDHNDHPESYTRLQLRAQADQTRPIIDLLDANGDPLWSVDVDGKITVPDVVVTVSVDGSEDTPYANFVDVDLGTGTFMCTVRLTAADADGEPVGYSQVPGEIVWDVQQLWQARTQEALDLVVYNYLPGSIPPGVEHAAAFGVLTNPSWLQDRPYPDAGDPLTVPVQTHAVVGVCAGHVRAWVNIIDSFEFTPYAGSNNPTGTWEFTFTRI